LGDDGWIGQQKRQCKECVNGNMEAIFLQCGVFRSMVFGLRTMIRNAV
jgi:hypothetical protein